MAGALRNVQALTILSRISPNSTRLSFSQLNTIMYDILSCLETFLPKCVTDCGADYRKARPVQFLYNVQALPRGHARLREWTSEGSLIP